MKKILYAILCILSSNSFASHQMPSKSKVVRRLFSDVGSQDKKEKEEKESAEVPYEKLSQKEKADIEAYYNLQKKVAQATDQIWEQEDKSEDEKLSETKLVHKRLFPLRFFKFTDSSLRVLPKPIVGKLEFVKDLMLISHDPTSNGWENSPINKFKPNEIVIVQKPKMLHPIFEFCIVKYKTANGYEIECQDTLKIIKPENIYKFGNDGIFALNEHDWNIENEIEQKRLVYEKDDDLLEPLNKYFPDIFGTLMAPDSWKSGAVSDRIVLLYRAAERLAKVKGRMFAEKVLNAIDLLDQLLKRLNDDINAQKDLSDRSGIERHAANKQDVREITTLLNTIGLENASIAQNDAKIEAFGKKIKPFIENPLLIKDQSILARAKRAFEEYTRHQKMMADVQALSDNMQRGSLAKKYPLITQLVKEMKKWSLQNIATQKYLKDPKTLRETRNMIFWDELTQFLMSFPDKVTEAVITEFKDIQKESVIDEGAKEFIQNMLDHIEKHKETNKTLAAALDENMFQGAMAKKYPLISKLIPKIKKLSLQNKNKQDMLKDPHLAPEQRNALFWDSFSGYFAWNPHAITKEIRIELEELKKEPHLNEQAVTDIQTILDETQ